MTPKKSKKADLESKRGLFLLFGMALSLIAAIVVIQYEKGFVQEDTSFADMPFADNGPDMIRTVTEVEKLEKIKIEKKIPNDLPPEIVEDDDVKLLIKTLFKPDDEGPKGLVEIKGPSDLDKIETIKYVNIEHIARPKECGDISDKSEQRDCFNAWIKRYISENTNYPELAKQLGLEERIFVNFVVSENGDIEDVMLMRGENEILAKEALRVVSQMPQMIPGRNQSGRNAKMTMTIPVNFTLSKY